MNTDIIRRNQMLAPYLGSTSLTELEAHRVLTTIWPTAEGASPAEFYKAMKLCVQYGLNPLMGHLFLVPFWNTKKKSYDFTCIRAITSNRLIASRRHRWTYLDDTPRIGTDEEIKKHYGNQADVDNRLYGIAKIKDMDTGAEVNGWGEWPLTKLVDGKTVPNQPKGIDKGNSMVNMVCIHAERNGLDKLYPAEMPPQDIPVVDEGEIEELQKRQPKIKVTVENESSGEPPEDATGEATGEPAPELEKEVIDESPSLIDLAWLRESLKALQDKKLKKWSNRETIAHLNTITGSQATTVTAAVKALNKEQSEAFVKEIQDILSMI